MYKYVTRAQPFPPRRRRNCLLLSLPCALRHRIRIRGGQVLVLALLAILKQSRQYAILHPRVVATHLPLSEFQIHLSPFLGL